MVAAPRSVSRSVVKRWMKAHNLRRYKTSSLDPKRAQKATAYLRDKWFALIANYVTKLYADAKIPWPRFDKIPSRCKYNVDEDAANVAKGRQPGLNVVNAHADKMGRMFDISNDGDRMVNHVTDVAVTRADGQLRAPCIIKKRGGGDNAKEAAL